MLGCIHSHPGLHVASGPQVGHPCKLLSISGFRFGFCNFILLFNLRKTILVIRRLWVTSGWTLASSCQSFLSPCVTPKPVLFLGPMLWAIRTVFLVFAERGGGGDTSQATLCISSASSQGMQTCSALIVLTMASYAFISIIAFFAFHLYLHKELKRQIHSDFFCFLNIKVRFIDAQGLDDERLLSSVSCYSSPFPAF